MADAPWEQPAADGPAFLRSFAEVEKAYEETLDGWIRAIDLRDHETEGHSRRVMDLAVALGVELGFGGEQLASVRRGALLHDVGKMALPDRVLLKPGPLDDEERALIQLHPQFAREMLVGIEFLAPSLDIPWAHHERWDGRGYPRGLGEDEIPYPARLFSVVDVWDALRSDRLYRKGWTAARVAEHLDEESGRAFDPRVVTAFLALLRRRGEIPG